MSANEKLKSIESKIKGKLGDSEKEKSASFIGGKEVKKNYEGEKSMRMSDEKRLLSSFGVRNVKGLLETNVAHPRFAHVDNATKSAALALKNDVDTARFMSQMFEGGALDRNEKTANVNLLENSFAKNIDLGARLKAFGSEVAGSVDEWVPTLISQNYIEEFHLEHKLAKHFKQIPMASSPFEMPVQTSSHKAKAVAEGASKGANEFGTEKITLKAEKASTLYNLPEELNEDSAPAILQLARQEVVASCVRAIESAIINGDVTGTHMDSDITGDDFDKICWFKKSSACSFIYN